MLDQLKTLKPFRGLDAAQLATVQRHADRLRLPGQRWLRRRGQPLARELFLLDGVVAVRDQTGSRRIAARDLDRDSLNARVPDAVEISTVTSVDVIAVDMAAVRPLLEGAPEEAAPAVSGVDGWVHALLGGPVMRWFPPSVWARLLRAGTPRRYRQGDLVVACGDVPDNLFVVGEGFAANRARRYGPGDFFAEESALLRRPATEDTVMETDGTLVLFAPDDILDLMPEYNVPRVDAAQRLDLDALADADEDALLGELSGESTVAIRGGTPARRLVVAAKLMRRGVTVV